MGATDFMTEATGRTPDEAYRSAVDDARYWHGHGGYSGSIAEKDGYYLWDIPLGTLKPVPDGMRTRTTTERLANALNAIDWDVDEFLKRKVNPEWEWDVLAHMDVESLVGAMGKARFQSLVEHYHDKWGSAVAIKTGDDTYTFMGLASC